MLVSQISFGGIGQYYAKISKKKNKLLQVFLSDKLVVVILLQTIISENDL